MCRWLLCISDIGADASLDERDQENSKPVLDAALYQRIVAWVRSP
jgi:hypothetical protein